MDGLALSSVTSLRDFGEPQLDANAAGRDPEKVREAAAQFEALLIGQLLRAAQADGNWMGSGEDSASSSAMDFAQEHLAAALSRAGGLGLAAMVVEGLERTRPGKQEVSAANPAPPNG